MLYSNKGNFVTHLNRSLVNICNGFSCHECIMLSDRYIKGERIIVIDFHSQTILNKRSNYDANRLLNI
jgi:hypothetical protein